MSETILADVLAAHIGPGSQGRYCRCGAMGTGNRGSNHATHVAAVVTSLLASDDVREAVANAIARETFRSEGGADLLADGVDVEPDPWGADHQLADAALAAVRDTLGGGEG